MVERIFAQQTLATSVIESEQTGDHCFRRSGLRVSDGLLEGNAACSGIEGDIRQPKALGPALIAEAEINPFCAPQVSGQADQGSEAMK